MSQRSSVGALTSPSPEGQPGRQIRPHEAVCCWHGEGLLRAFQKQSVLQWVTLSLPGHVCPPALALVDTESRINP